MAAKLCPHCKHLYMRPCTDRQSKSCPNWLFLQERAKAKKAPTKKVKK